MPSEIDNNHDHGCGHDHKHDDANTHGHDHNTDSSDEHCYYKGGPLSHELFSHLPFSVLSVTLGLIVAGLVCFMTTDQMLVRANIAIEEAHAGHDHGSHAGHDHGSHAGHDHGSHAGHDHGEPSTQKSHAGHDHSSHAGHDHGSHAGHDHSSHADEGKKETKPEDTEPSSIGFLFLFHLFHPAHILFSAVATTAMFYRYEKNIFKAVLVGFCGSIIICSVSDALIPSLTTKAMGFSAPFHLCISETPGQIITFATIGVLLGLISVQAGTIKSTISSHSIHVASSTMATIFYVVAFTGRLEWINQIGLVFLMTCVAVGGVCCISDVILPLLFTKKARKEYAINGHDHPH